MIAKITYRTKRVWRGGLEYIPIECIPIEYEGKGTNSRPYMLLDNYYDNSDRPNVMIVDLSIAKNYLGHGKLHPVKRRAIQHALYKIPLLDFIRKL